MEIDNRATLKWVWSRDLFLSFGQRTITSLELFVHGEN